MPRFAVLQHDWPEPHSDVLWEDGPVLKAWRVFGEFRPGTALAAERNFDHRLMYLDYEGPLSGDRGSVTCWDRGTFEWIERDDERRWVVNVHGQQLTGTVEFRKTEAGTWQMIWTESC
jgi:hypothetical protein